jgi:hypothetical protein
MKLSNQKKNARRWFMGKRLFSSCPNCGGLGRHYVPASMGEEGYYACPTPSLAKEDSK